jgi:hypothetical protein
MEKGNTVTTRWQKGDVHYTTTGTDRNRAAQITLDWIMVKIE